MLLSPLFIIDCSYRTRLTTQESKMKSKLFLNFCLATLALFCVVTPGQSVELVELKCGKGNEKVLSVRYDFMNGNIRCSDDEKVPLSLFRPGGLPPIVKYKEAKEGTRYLLLMVDPDAPSAKNPVMRYWLHWVVTQIQGEDLKRGIESQDWGSIGRTLMTYAPPTPPPGSGSRRYQFFLFEEPPTHPIILTPEQQKHRGKFDLKAFLKDMKFGDPEAATYFVTENAGDRDEL
ncbi:PREDICTED: phosphatidylethanolamine-binding protein 4-like isoform X1 [Branchiostoma belcheri]|uniref:Phosphatidylethanolamine-binding protein 4-like isoform X1 n=1 Tax=Branchiostoma belcheri TaxID=7741 RepID=A0A6P4YBE6_BRABE|nr:PREDICTED: phosphatidylethanolamine-binding protein 4-like isoform X1 [Branchiostoma belcheri]